jgi:hypothetical protein
VGHDEHSRRRRGDWLRQPGADLSGLNPRRAVAVAAQLDSDLAALHASATVTAVGGGSAALVAHKGTGVNRRVVVNQS